ncbi:hypothetical protein FLONG3_17 [Fusarium longipes]|uniref:Apple domain-containing protein n=1 Tax=Fusarium longipes TaxID=694270 RepID=A0A395TBU9_9HYPO|nr:hypothetical protein FLONG3_17 [Fusarium longipes]
MRLQRSLAVLWASLLASCLGITIGPQTGGLGMARILFNGSQDVLSSSSGYSGDPSAIRPFTNGPFGMEKGIILSTGSLTSPFGPGDMCPSSYTTDMYDEYTTTYCGANSYNGAIFLLNVLPTKATTFLVDIIIASCDLASADKVFVFANGVNYAKDENGIALDSSSKYLNEPWGIPAPNGDTAFTMSSPPLRFSIPLPKSYVELKIAVCDRLDGYGDTAVMIKIRPCNDCSQTFKVDYDTTSITSTTTYEAVSTVTQPASGTVRGTISYITYVTPTAASTTLSAPDSSSSTSSATFTSLAPVSCYQMTNPYRLPSGSQFEVNCNSYSTDGDQIGSTLDAIDLSQCIDLCVDTTNCKAALFDRSQSLCYLMDGSDGPVLNNLYDMAVLLSSAPSAATSSTSSDALSTMISSEVTTTTPSSTSPPTPLSCREMAGSIYTGPHENKFTLTCDTVSVGESIYRRAEEDSMEGCVAMCDSDNRCLAVNFYPYPDSECHLVESFATLLSESESSVSSSSEHLSESTSEASTRPAESPSSLESTADIVTAITGSTNTITDTKLSTTDTSDVKSATTDTPVFETSTLTTLASTTGSTATSSDLSQISQPLITVQSTGSTVERDRPDNNDSRVEQQQSVFHPDTIRWLIHDDIRGFDFTFHIISSNLKQC